MGNNESSIVAKIATIIAITVIVIGGYFFLTEPQVSKKKYQENKQENQVNIGGDFELINTQGERENTKKYSDKYKLIYFGFTYCPDICPTSLAFISEVVNELENYNINIVPIFVTIDPERDTVDVLGPYIEHFNKKFIGYTGSKDEIRKVADMYKVFYAKAPREDAEEKDYLIDHSSFIYFISPESKYIKHFSSSSSIEEVVLYVRSEINNKKLSK